MRFVSNESIQYLVRQGRHKGDICQVLRYYFANTNLESVANVRFPDSPDKDNTTIMASDLEEINPPGWPLTEKEYERRCHNYYGLEHWFLKEAGTGSNLIRTDDFAQPRALRIGDRLVYGETIEKIRTGYNSSVIIFLGRHGWVELASRLPIALVGCKDFSLPESLLKDDVLATGCRIMKRSSSYRKKDGWFDIYLDRNSCDIEVPGCIPLAIA